jgi:hypothetical protein
MDLKGPINTDISTDMHHNADCNMHVVASREMFQCQMVVMHVSVLPGS